MTSRYLPSIFFLLFLLLPASQAYAFEVPITVKETTGTAANQYPIDLVFPLPQGQYQDVDSFTVRDSSGKPVPAQITALTRWWAIDNSIRDVKVHFQPSVAPFTGPKTGISTYTFSDSGAKVSPASPVSVRNISDGLVVDTGPLQVTFGSGGAFIESIVSNSVELLDKKKEQENTVLLTESKVVASAVNRSLLASIFDASIGILKRLSEIFNDSKSTAAVVTSTFDEVRDRDKATRTVEIEESGPLRAVIKVSSLSGWNSTAKEPVHGFAARYTFYAGKSFFKVEYQLQNAPKQTKFGWPLYFKGHEFRLSLAPDLVPASDILQKQTTDTPRTRMKTIARGSTSVLAAIPVRAWETWPWGSKVTTDGKLTVEMWPTWGRNPGDYNGYWIWDMGAEMRSFYLFAGPSSVTDTEIGSLAKLMSDPPVAVVPPSVRGVPGTSPVLSDTKRTITLTSLQQSKDSSSYALGRTKFYDIDPNRRVKSCTTGGFPWAGRKFWLTGNPADYYADEAFAMVDLNQRPQWMPGYTYSADYGRLGLNQAAYCSGTWRSMGSKTEFSNGVTTDYLLIKPQLLGSKRLYAARDDEHGWLYHVEDVYRTTGNPWIKDWYNFLGEFRIPHVLEKAPYAEGYGRGWGHSFSALLSAYRVTGNPNYLEVLRTGVRRNPWKTTQTLGEHKGGFQTGYVAQALMEFTNEIPKSDPDFWLAWHGIAGRAEWNYSWGHYPYFCETKLSLDTNTPCKSSITSATQLDVAAWYYWQTGRKYIWTEANKYIYPGINGGQHVSYPFDSYRGEWLGWEFATIKNALPSRSDWTPPAKITDTRAILLDGNVSVTFTTPSDAEWVVAVASNIPISPITITNTSFANWWSTRAIVAAKAKPGTVQTLSGLPATLKSNLTSTSGYSQMRYVSVFSLDAAQNMSEVSDTVAIEGSGAAVPPSPPTEVTLDKTPPTVSVTAPTLGSSVSGVVTVAASASDVSSGVRDVTLLIDGTVVGVADTLPPYSFSWNTTAYANGEHSVQAQARDTSGNTAVSTIVKVVVDNGTVSDSTSTLLPDITLSSSDYTQTHTCTSPLKPGSSCLISVTFRPRTAGTRTGTLSFVESVTGKTTSISLTGIAKDDISTTEPGSASTTVSTSSSFIPNLIGHWTFDSNDTGVRWTSTTGAIAVDTSGKNNNGTLINMSLATPPATGKIGQALSFDGLNDAIIVSKLNNFEEGNTDITISAWVYPRTLAVNTPIIGEDISATAKEWGVQINSGTGKVNFRYVTEDGTYVSNTTTNGVELNAWNHVVIVISRAGSKNLIQGYLNGVEEVMSNTKMSDKTWDHSDAQFQIGALRVGTADAILDEVLLYNRALSAAEVHRLYNLDATATTISDAVSASTVAVTEVSGIEERSSMYGVFARSIEFISKSVNSVFAALRSSLHNLALVLSFSSRSVDFGTVELGSSIVKTITVTVSEDGSISAAPLTVSVTKPSAGSSHSGTISVAATVSDVASVKDVTLLVDGTVVGAADTLAPYSFSWNTTSHANGEHTLQVRLRDKSGNTTVSEIVKVIVKNAEPLPNFDDSPDGSLDSTGQEEPPTSEASIKSIDDERDTTDVRDKKGGKRISMSSGESATASGAGKSADTIASSGSGESDTAIGIAAGSVEDRPITIAARHFSLGESSSDIRIIQRLLNRDIDTQIAVKGYGAPGNETDTFGLLTQEAVKRFQVKHHIVSSGSPSTTGFGALGPRTITKLLELYGGSSVSLTPVSVSAPSVSPGIAVSSKSGTLIVSQLGIGSTGPQVSLLQRHLATDPSLYPEALVTGYFGPATQRAVKRFQTKYGIVSSGSPEITGYGNVGPTTRALLNQIYGG